MATLREYFDVDFSNLLHASRSFTVSTSPAIEVFARVHSDFEANVKFVSVYLPASEATEAVCRALADEIATVLDIDKGTAVGMGRFGERHMLSSDLRFSGRLFVYHETELSEDAQERLIAFSREKGVLLQFRGSSFAAQRSRYERPEAFICHDSRDKESVAKPIALGLAKRICPVWFDEFSLKVGDRLRESIERGLREADKCILVLTPNFLSNEGWTKTEFNSIFTRELVEKRDVILPVWCGVEREDVYSYSPSLADRFAAKWSDGEDKVVNDLHAVIRG